MKSGIRKIIYLSIISLLYCTDALMSQTYTYEDKYSIHPLEIYSIQHATEINGNYSHTYEKLIAMGDSLYHNNKKNAARVMYERVVPYIFLYRPGFIPVLYLKIGNTYENNSKAAEYYQMALTSTLPTKQGILIKAKLLTNIAGIAIDNGDYNKALSNLNATISIFTAQKDTLDLSKALANKAKVYSLSDKKEEAITDYITAFKLIAHRRDKPFIQLQSQVIYNVSGLYLDINKPDSALFYLSQITPLFEKLPDEYQLIHQYLLGGVFASKKEYVKAEYYILYSLSLAEKADYKNILLHSYRALGNLYTSTGNYKKALEYGIKYINMQRGIFEQTKVDINKINQLESDYTLAQKDKALTEKQLLIARQERNLTQKNLWLVIILSGMCLMAVLSWGIVRGYRRKQKLLQKEQEINMLKALIAGEEKERQRLSRELHDGIGGMLAAINLKINDIGPDSEKESIFRQLNDIVVMLQDTSSEVRATAHNLLPDMLNHYHLIEALLAYIKKINTNGKVHIVLDVPNRLSILSKPVELILFRIIQELIHNATQHADAANIDIQIIEHGNELILLVEDNGKGFNPYEDIGYGLNNVRSRVDRLQGSLEIDSALDKGTAIKIHLNLQKLNEIIA